MKSLSIGRLVYDINIMMEGYPIEGTENVTKEMIPCSGGTANIVAYSLGKWNMESFISGVIGYDETGTAMKKNMEENKVRTNFLETNYDIKTPTSYIFINKQNNSHTVVKTEINNYNIKKYEYDTDVDLVVVDGSEYNASVYAFNKYSNAVTILNAQTPQNRLLDFFKYAKYVVASKEVAEAITGLKMDLNNPLTMSNIYKKIVDKFPHITLLITMEEKGVIYSINNEIKVLATINSDVIDKSGAKDVFVAMVGYGIINKYDLETTLRLATIAENMSKQGIGSTLSIPILSDIIKYYENKFGTLNNNIESDNLNNSQQPIADVEKIEEPVKQEVQNSQGNQWYDNSEILNQNLENSKSDEQILNQVFGNNVTISEDDNDTTA